MYIGSYHRAARRAANALTTPGTRVRILSAMYGLLNPDDVILRYEMRLGQRHAITAQGLREQAEQLGLTHTSEVIVLAPAAYADLATQVWPHALLPLAGTRGIGEQMARLSALATGRTTVEDLVNPQTGPDEPETHPGTGSGSEPHTVSVHGGLVHLAHTAPGRGGTAVPVCPAGRPGRRWTLTPAAITCTRCAAIATRRRALDRWCALVTRCAQTTNTGTAHRDGPAAPATQRDRSTSTRPGRGRPATTDRRRPARPIPARRPGGTPRRTHRDNWRLVPTGPPQAVPLQPTAVPPADQPSRKRNPHHPRPPIGRAPPGVSTTRVSRHAARRQAATVPTPSR